MSSVTHNKFLDALEAAMDQGEIDHFHDDVMPHADLGMLKQAIVLLAGEIFLMKTGGQKTTSRFSDLVRAALEEGR